MKSLDELFNEEESRLAAEGAQRVASGQDARETAAMLARAESEHARLVAHGCIEEESEDFDDEDDEEEE